MAFSTTTSTGPGPYVLKTGGKGMWTRTAMENILFYANLLLGGFNVKLEVGRPGDPNTADTSSRRTERKSF